MTDDHGTCLSALGGLRGVRLLVTGAPLYRVYSFASALNRGKEISQLASARHELSLGLRGAQVDVMAETYVLNYSTQAVYECGATILTVLAAPGRDSLFKAELHASLCAKALRVRYRECPDDITPMSIKLCHAFRGEAVIDSDMLFVQRHLDRRLSAVWIAWPFLQEAEHGRLPEKPAGLSRYTINSLAEYFLEYSGHSDVANFKSRAWVTSLPVIHLAAAAMHEERQILPVDLLQGIEQILWSQERQTAIVNFAETFELLVAKSPKLARASDELIKIRIA